MAALQRIEGHVEHSHVVGHEEGIKLAALKRLRETLKVREVKIGIRESAGIPPCSGMDTRRPHESCELQLTWSRHCQSLSHLPMRSNRSANIAGLMFAENVSGVGLA